MLNIKKIIQEEVNMFVHQQKFKDSIPFLSQFEFVSSGIQKDGTHDWLFSKNWKEFLLRDLQTI